MSNTAEFEDQLKRDGYLDIKHRQVERGEDTMIHKHDFDTRLLVLSGELTVVCDDNQRTYRVGEILEIAAEVEHFELYGQDRLSFVAGLRRKFTNSESPTR
jgi:mannose-6-phosphate isomerase-like protein (cupin superfamily)